MSADRPTDAQPLDQRPVTTPRESASVILVRDAAAGPELLLVRRNPAQRFMGGFWVFPGGALDARDGAGGDGHRAAAVRELREEAGVTVDPRELVPYSRWITPEAMRIRFDTRFFVARAPADARPRPDGAECVAMRWSRPRAALREHAAGELALVLPTRRHLEELSAFGSVEELLAHARTRDVQPVRPHAVRDGSGTRVVLPGEDRSTGI
jgi:8-oxo-dGTP pyrophosphatase MutT (NUDIX family)